MTRATGIEDHHIAFAGQLADAARAVLARETNVDITDAVVTELNRILPSVTITPPAGYQPGQLVQQRNQQLMDAARAQQGTAAPAAPANGSQPTTR